MKKVILVIMDGVGVTNQEFGNAYFNANTPNLDYLMKNYPNTLIHAHGKYVGLNDDDMGNSEVGHNALGSGQIYAQGAKLVDMAINDKSIYKSSVWHELVNYVSENNAMHFIGLLSDGNVHSHINHLLSLIKQAKEEGIKKVCVHILLDGRDVEPLSALKYVDILENEINALNDDNFKAQIASGGGRMKITMDRYEANLDMVKLGLKTHVLGKGRGFKNATDAITTLREETNAIDQDLDPFVIVDGNGPVGQIKDGDAVIFFNFRGDRAIEISRCFDDPDYLDFKMPKVMYAGMLEYDADFKIPKRYLVEPPKIVNTLTEELCKHNVKEYAISETQKYGHVTYFWNGNRPSKINEDLEDYEEVKSDIIPFDQKPEMKAYEITDKLIEAIKSQKYDFLRINYPNGDMVGHTGNYLMTIKAIEAVDDNIGRIMKTICNLDDTVLIILADHGNSEEMYEKDKKTVKTSHTKNPVPFILYGKDISSYKIKQGDFGLANVANTILTLLDIENKKDFKESIIEKENF